MAMIMRADPFRQLDRFAQQVMQAAAADQASLMLMDAWRDADMFYVEFDLPGVDRETIDVDVERNVVTVKASRPGRGEVEEVLASERPRGEFSRQLVLGENLDTDRITAKYSDGVLLLKIPVAEKAKPRKVTIETSEDAKVIDA